MDDLEWKNKILEEKVCVLEDILYASKCMQLSEQKKAYIQNKTKVLRIIDLLNAVLDEPLFESGSERRRLENMRAEKTAVNTQTANAWTETESSLANSADDPRYFEYVIEYGAKGGPTAPILAPFARKSIRITGYNGFESEQVIIVPKKIDGYPVVSIGKGAFKGVAASKIILPNSLKVILDDAFNGCENLTQVDLPNSLEYMGDACFFNCKNLTHVGLPNGLAQMGANCFANCESLNRVDLPNSLENLGFCCFMNSGLTSIIINDSLPAISALCFAGCKNLENVVIGNGVRIINMLAFHCCAKLNQITLPNSVGVINECAFAGTSLQTMIFPKGLKRLSGAVFTPESRFAFNCNNNKYYVVEKNKNTQEIACIFLGLDTKIVSDTFDGVSLIYCLPGSKVQRFAYEHSIPVKPLSEFKMEDYT